VREVLRGPVRSAFIAVSVVGLLLVAVNPPSLSGAEGLLRWTAGGLALFLLTAWATVALSGEQDMSEPEFERLVRRTEELAKDPRLARQATEFELLVAEAIDRLPPDFQSLLETTPVVVSQLGAEHGAYGHYFGDTVARDNHHDRIVLYQDTLERDFGWDQDVLAAQVERTLQHELAHHLGWHERGVRELGL
jgi:predicted Zn-dependent protease with MMP-like domain